MFLFSGFFIRYNSIPKGWRWFSALSMFKYPLEAMIRNMLDEEEERSGNEEVTEATLFFVLFFFRSFILFISVLVSLVSISLLIGGNNQCGS